MVGSSLRNALHRRNHKERAQLTGRSRLGLLEKKKDYAQRARDYHSKQDRIHRLQEKAAMRNKDEFYFSMINSRTKAGVHVQERGNASIPVDTVKILKSQDENYIRTMRTAGLKRIAALKLELSNLINLLPSSQSGAVKLNEYNEAELQALRSVGLISFSSPTASVPSKKNRSQGNSARLRGSHVVFQVVSDHDEAKKHDPPSSPATIAQTPNDSEGEIVDLGWKDLNNTLSTPTRRRRKGKSNQLANSKAPSTPQEDTSQRLAIATANRNLLIAELSARLERDASLKDALLEIKNQRLRMQNGSKRLIDTTSESRGEDANSKGFTFNMNREDDSDNDQGGGSNREGKWKPKVYKWKFQRKR